MSDWTLPHESTVLLIVIGILTLVFAAGAVGYFAGMESVTCLELHGAQ